MKLVLSIIIGLFSLTIFGQVQMEIEGSMKIGKHIGATPDPGTIQWTGRDFEVWNGLNWASLTTGRLYEEGSVTDINGYVYRTVRIGTREWMGENLRTNRYRDGSFIDASGTHTYLPDNDPQYLETYGRAYDWHATTNAKGVCPTGWNVPTRNDFETLLTYVDDNSIHLKEQGLGHWKQSEFLGTDWKGFTALPGSSYSYSNDLFFSRGSECYFWTRDNYSGSQAYRARINNSSTGLEINYSSKLDGRSIRCIKY